MISGSYISDQLTHFVGRSLADDESRYALLREIVQTGWLKASHRDELGPGFVGHSNGGKALSSNDAVKCTSVCLCDIPIATLKIHMKKYSSFGLAFDKRLMLRSGATPVHYVARNARHRGVGIGPRAVGDWFDQLRKDVQTFAHDLGSYVTSHEGDPPLPFKTFLSRYSAGSSPHGAVLGNPK